MIVLVTVNPVSLDIHTSNAPMNFTLSVLQNSILNFYNIKWIATLICNFLAFLFVLSLRAIHCISHNCCLAKFLRTGK